jgi:ArsR family transcriptional regulator
MPDLLEIMKSLSDETRLNLVKLLLEHDFCVGAIARKLSVSESAVSQHLKVLRTAGLVKGEKRGYFTHYYVDRKMLKWVANQLITLSETGQIHNSSRK